jgi:hypothetical protein
MTPPEDDTPIPLVDPSELPRPPADAHLAAILERAERIASGEVYPSDYLAVTPEVHKAVERDMTYARSRGGGAEVAAEVQSRQLRERLLSFHHGGQTVCYVEDGRGIIVLADGLHDIGHVLRSFAARWPEPLSVATPDEFV